MYQLYMFFDRIWNFDMDVTMNSAIINKLLRMTKAERNKVKNAAMMLCAHIDNLDS